MIALGVILVNSHYSSYKGGIFEEFQSSVVLPNKTWVSMALCWGYKVDLFQKSHFPYAYAGWLSSDLWPKVTEAGVIFQIVICNESAKVDNFRLSEYVELLKLHGASVKLLYSSTCDQTCVTEAQVARFMAFSFPEVRNEYASSS